MATKIGDQIILDGTFGDWPANSMIMVTANTVAGYQVYGALLDDATLGETYVIGIDATASSDAVIGPGTIIYLNTDQNAATGYSPSGTAVGAEYEIRFALDSTGALQATLYATAASGATTLLNGGAPLDSGISTNGESVEVAIPQSLLTPAGGAVPTAIDFDAMISNGSATGAATTSLPGSFAAATPEYVIPNAAATTGSAAATVSAATTAATVIGGAITLNGTFTDFPSGDMIMTSANTVANYQVYGAGLDDATLGPTYVIGIDATSSSDPVIAAGTTIYLNTDQNAATGYSPSWAAGKIGAEFEVVFAKGSSGALAPFLYSVTSAGALTELNSDAALDYGFSSNGESVEVAIPQSLLTPSGGTAPGAINFAALINNATGLPGDFNNATEYTIAAPPSVTVAPVSPPASSGVKKVGIVYSATTAALYFGGGATGETAYSDLFMTAQEQADAAGVSYDLLTEADLTNVAKLSQYSALIFPDFQDVQSSQVSAITTALEQVVTQYHIPIITSGDFMTNDQNGNALSGNPYASMQSVLNLTQSGYGTATYSVQPDPTALASKNPILSGYTSGELIGGASGLFAGTTTGYYTSSGYETFAGDTAPATTIADIDISGGSTLPGVVQSTTGATDFATTGLFGDSNLLQHVIQNAVFGTTPSLTMDITRFKGVLNSRTDMDQSQFTSDVSPTSGTGIYTEMIPILQQLYNEYDFVGTDFINIGNDPSAGESTNWSVSTPYYDQILELGNEIGDHSYTHLLNPPTTTVPATTSAATAAGSTQITVNALPGYNGSTLDMIVTDPSNPSAIGDNTLVAAVTDNTNGTYTLTLVSGGGGVLAAIPAGATLDFGIPTEDTNFLGTTGTGTFTYAYEFGQSKSLESSNIGITVAGAAVPGENDYLPDSEQILSYFPTTSSVTGYVNGGWTGVGSGSPNAIGYITPSETSSVYIAPNITFDFTEVQYEGKTAASSLADWESLFNQLSANSETPIIVWPWHDYGITDYPTDGPGTAAPGYSEAMYADFIQYAYDAGYEFVTSEDLAQRVAAEQAATLSESTATNASGATVITASVTPSASEPDLGAMALNVANGGSQVIENAGSWYAYDTNSVFLANDTAGKAAPETFTVTLGATQDNVTHVEYLPMRADLLSVTGDGTNLTFSFTGDGTVDLDLKTPGTNIVSVQSSIAGTEGAGATAPTATLTGDVLALTFDDGLDSISSSSPQGVPVEHTVTITEAATAVAGATFVFGAPTVAPTVAIAGVGGLTDQKTVTITGTATEPTESQVVGTTVSLYDNGSTTALGSATVSSTGSWSATVTLTGDGTHSIVAKDTDLSKATGSSTAVVYTLDTAAPTVAITTAGGAITQATQTIAGTVATTEAAAGSTVTLTDNGTEIGTATLSNGAWSTVVTLSAGSNSITAKDTDAAGNTGTSSAVVYTYSTTVTTGAPAITSETYSGSSGSSKKGGGSSGGHWVLGGTATAGATVTVADGTTTLGTATATSTGTWTYTTSESESAIHVYTATSTSGSSAPVYEGTTGNDVFDFASEAAVSAAALINGNGGTDTLLLTAAAQLTDADFAHVQAIQILGLTGASGVTLGANAAKAGVTTVTAGAGATSVTDTNAGTLTVNAAAISGATLTLAGSTAMTVTTGSGSLAIADTSTGALTVNAAALASGATLTLSGSGAMTVTTGAGAINASAMMPGQTLTLKGSTATTVTAGGALDASADTGALAITATGAGTTIKTGSGTDTVAAAQGGNTIAVNGKGDSINVTGHTAADSFVWSATSASLNSASGRDTITGFAAGGSINDLLNVSAINASLKVQGALASSTTKVAADSIAWLYSGGAATVYVNDTTGALATSKSSLMAITLAGVSSGLSASNFVA